METNLSQTNEGLKLTIYQNYSTIYVCRELCQCINNMAISMIGILHRVRNMASAHPLDDNTIQAMKDLIQEQVKEQAHCSPRQFLSK